MVSNKIRFSGLSSGIDTDNVVKAMLAPQQSKIDKQKQQETLLNWKKDAWKDMNYKLNTFFSKYVNKLRFESTFGKSIVSNSNTNALSVDTTSNIPAGTHKIEISQVATTAYMQNKGMSAVSHLTDSNTLKDLGITENTKIRIEKLNADGSVADVAQITLKANDTLDDINEALQNEGTNLQLVVADNKIKITSSGSGAERTTIKVVSNNTDPDGEFQGDSNLLSKLGFSNSLAIKEGVTAESGDFSTISKGTRLSLLGITSGIINVKSKPIDLSVIGTIGELETAIKAADSSLNVNFDVANKRFFISTKETGISAKIEISGAYLEELGLLHQGAASTLQGVEAIYKYNDMQFASQSNIVTVNGIRMTLKEKTTTPITISATRDLQAVADTVKEFIEQYNALIEEIDSKVNAKKSYKYNPLTDEQKKDMKEADIKSWEDKIKQSLFSNDPQLKDVANMMREILGSAASGGAYKTLSDVGITTGNWKEGGKLYFDEEKFKTSLEKDSQGVIDLFTGGQNSILATDKGIFTKLYEKMNSEMKSTKIRTYGSFYNDKPVDDSLKNISDKIYSLEQTYSRMEEMYYKKFTAMEKMLSQLNSQSNWLTAQLGGM